MRRDYLLVPREDECGGSENQIAAICYYQEGRKKQY